MSGRPPVCKFFKQGKCQYGNNCRFYHPGDVDNYGSNNAYGNSNPFGGNGFNAFNTGNSSLGAFGNSSPSKQEDISQFCNPSTISQRETEIRNDMNELSESLQVSENIFTSYSLKPPASVNLIANRDLSFEETRIQYYLAQSTNSLPSHQQQLTKRVNDMKSCITFLRNNTQKAVRYLQLALQNPNTTPKPLIPPFDPNVQTNSAPVSSANSIFGLPNSSNPFGGSVSNQSPFGNTNSSAGTSNPFGVSTNSNKSNPFAGTSNSQSPFTQLGSSTTSTGAFASSGFTSKPSGGAFGSQASPFGNASSSGNAGPSTSSGFGSSGFGSSGFGSSGFGNSGFGASATPTATTVSNPFGGSSKLSNPFGGSTTTTPAVAGTTGTTPFGGSGFGNSGFGNTKLGGTGFGSTGFGSASTGSGFGKSEFNTQSNPPMNNINPFGGQSFSQTSANSTTGGNNTFATNSNPFGSSTQASFIGSSQTSSQPVVFYKQGGIDDPPTKLEDLGDEVVQIFKSEKFELGRVPDIPPPLELC